MQEKNMSQIHDNMSELGPGTEVREVTKFVDDVQPETYEKPMMSTPTVWTSMAEDTKLHDIHAILQRPVRVLDSEFVTAFTNVNLKFPDVILQNSTNVVSKLDYFTYFRANVKVKLMFNATPFMSGKYWMYFAPFDVISNRGSRQDDLPNVTGYPGTEIDLASGAPVEIKIPYCAPLSHYNLLDTHSNMGELYVVPLNGIQTNLGTIPAGSGAPFTIFAWFEDIELALPTSKPVTVPTLLEEDEVFEAQIGEEAAATGGPKISGVAASIAGAASAAGSMFPKLGAWVRPVEWVARAVSGAAEAVGWNKPTNLDKNCPYVNVPAKGYTNMTGIDLSSKLAAAPDNGLTYDGGLFSTEVDEMDLRYVAKKSCIFRANIGWSINDAVGDQLHANAVTPGMATGSQVSLNPTTLGFVTSMFRYWRGTIKYRLTVAKTAFHTGRLRITYHPGVYDYTTVGKINQNAYNWILDLSVTSELEFEIPYVANVPWKETIVTDYNDVTNLRKEKFSTGHISVEVLTPLRASTDNVANNCPINMWLCGGDDISFAIPDFGNYVIDDNVVLLEDEDEVLEAQVFNLTSKGVEHNEQVSNTASRTFPMSNMTETKAEELTMGEKITNLRQLIKRFTPTAIGNSFPYPSQLGNSYCFIGPISLNNDSYLFNQLEIDPAFFGTKSAGIVPTEQQIVYPRDKALDGSLTTANFNAMRTLPLTNPLHYVSYLYRFYRGGRRYKIVNPSTNNIEVESMGWRNTADDGGIARTAYTNALDSTRVIEGRPFDPIYVYRDQLVAENGDITGPAIGTFATTIADAAFEHYVYPDINGTLEFEVPYYSQLPISLVGEGNISDTEGPLIRRSKIFIRRSHLPRGLDRPIYKPYATTGFPGCVAGTVDGGGIRPCFGGFSLYEAAADDFSFGYLIGAPKIVRLVNQP
ncbi:hypothetical protein 2 [Beihai picorna-like virus 72]|uniref:hypothetical protein 2 n=1 Tax=Beihai picorna-like virus 72 TaxID=1922619 RepID=UPI000909AB03|nr:hypothetical protein 2 [Beihai picorna-like virus 72]APG76751.1 hypothetical protein 2 [Beihai picorna-like virus 72]